MTSQRQPSLSVQCSRAIRAISNLALFASTARFEMSICNPQHPSHLRVLGFFFQRRKPKYIRPDGRAARFHCNGLPTKRRWKQIHSNMNDAWYTLLQDSGYSSQWLGNIDRWLLKRARAKVIAHRALFLDIWVTTAIVYPRVAASRGRSAVRATSFKWLKSWFWVLNLYWW